MPSPLQLLFALVGLVLIIAFGLFLSAKAGVTARDRRIAKMLEPVSDALRQRRAPNQATINGLAANPLTRNSLGELLGRFDRLDLFPTEHFGPIAMAESDMVSWLVHPHELAAVPDQIEHMASVTKDAGSEIGEVTYFVFRFRVHPPHSAAKDGWMAGVAGPFRMKDGQVLARGTATFSRFVAYEARSPEEHVGDIHDMALRRGQLKGL